MFEVQKMYQNLKSFFQTNEVIHKDINFHPTSIFISIWKCYWLARTASLSCITWQSINNYILQEAESKHW